MFFNDSIAISPARIDLLAGGGGGGTLTPLPVDYTLPGTAGAWSWFGDPRAIHYNGKTYFGYVEQDSGDIMVHSITNAARTVTAGTVLKAALNYDDHAAPSFLIRDSDKKIMAWYSAHNGTSLYQRISTTTEDISAFDAEADLDASLGGAAYDYSNPIQLLDETNDPIYLFYRESNFADTDKRHLAFSKSTDGGATWEAQTKLYTPGGVKISYFKIAQNGAARIDFAVTDGHPKEDTNTSIYHFYYEGGNYYQSDGTQIVASLPLAPGDLTKVYDGSGVADDSWVWDIAIASDGSPVIVFATFPDPDTDHRYQYAKWNGSAWVVNQIATAGKFIVDATRNAQETFSAEHYSGGVSLDHTDPTVVYLSRQSGTDSQWEVSEYVTADGGGTWSSQVISVGQVYKNIRPVGIRNHDGVIKALWLYGVYNWATTYNMQLHALIAGQSLIDDTPNTLIDDSTDILYER